MAQFLGRKKQGFCNRRLAARAQTAHLFRKLRCLERRYWLHDLDIGTVPFTAMAIRQEAQINIRIPVSQNAVDHVSCN